MAAYAQFGYGYPSANQLLGGVGQATAAAVTGIPPVSTGTAPSPLSGVNDASLSPSGGSATTGVTTTGPVSPGAISQTSNTAGSLPGNAAAAAVGIAIALGESHSAEMSAIAVGSGGGSALAAASAAAGGGSSATSCCENGRPIMTDPVSGQTVCSCQYDSARLALSSYSRMPAASVSVYGTPYPSTDQNPYPSIGVDSSAFYSPLSNPYALKESGSASDMTAWTSAGLQPTTGYYSYDPTLAAYGYGASYDLAARRKNATRESTATLKAWLNEHKKNPYPTKGEKIMLAIITKMTLTQVSTWFANARRRLKKENKMTWEPKNKTEDDDALLSDDEKEKESNDAEKSVGGALYGGSNISGDHKDGRHIKSEPSKMDKDDELHESERKPENFEAVRALGAYNAAAYGHHPGYNPYQQQQQPQQSAYYQQHVGGYGPAEENEYNGSKNPLSRDCGIPIPATKPKIWSLADTVACKTPPPATAAGATYMGQQQYYHQQTQHHQQQQPMLPATNGASMQTLQPQTHPTQHNSPLNMMNSYAGGSPYSRIPTGYGAPSNFSSPSHTNGMPTTPTSPPTMQHMAHQQQLQPPAHQYPHNHHQQLLQQQRMGGFPEIQPDTPPQTPPNMKLANSNSSGASSVASSLAAASALHASAAAVAATTGMCYTNSSGGSVSGRSNSASSSNSGHGPTGGYSSNNISPAAMVSNAFVANLARAET